MIFQEHPSEPQFFTEFHKLRKRRAEIAAWLKNPSVRPYNRLPWDSYGIPDLPARLAPLFNYKCVYCESLIVDVPSQQRVDLFRPPNNALPAVDGSDNDYYLWLVWEWRNLYFACADCVRHKGVNFPIKEQMRAAYGTPLTLIETVETPLLLDPCNPSINHLAEILFATNGHVKGLTPRAERTISLLKLDARDALIRGRCQACEEITRLYNTCAATPLARGKAIDDASLQTLRNACEDNVPFAGPRRQHLRNLLEADRRFGKGRWEELSIQLEKWVPSVSRVKRQSSKKKSLNRDDVHDDLELWLRKVADGYEVTAYFTPCDSDVTEDLIPSGALIVDINFGSLIECYISPERYSRILSTMLFTNSMVREAMIHGRAHARGARVPLRFRLRLEGNDPDLHAVRWELLRDPTTSRYLCQHPQFLFSRYLDSQDDTPVAPAAEKLSSAIIAVAMPSDITQYGLKPSDKEREIERACLALTGVHVNALPACTLEALTRALWQGPDILYLYCHGAISTDTSRHAVVYLESVDGTTEAVSAQSLVDMIVHLPHRPRLVVLASCQSAGSRSSEDSLLAFGPMLAKAGVGAVIAAFDDLTTKTIDAGIPVLFTELLKHGRIDQAMVAARVALAVSQDDWWRLVLFLRLRDGRIFRPSGRR